MAGKKILIIDDEDDLVEMLVLRLEAEGFEVHKALDGLSGLKAAASFKPDAIILDLIMPQIDGWEVLNRLKQDPTLRQIPVLIATAAVSRELEGKGKKLNASKVLVKPFNEKELIAHLKEFIGKSI